MKSWGVSDSLKLYNIESWGSDFFNVNPSGIVTVYPKKGQGPGIDIVRVIQDVQARGLDTPVLLRFQDIIRDRVVTLNETFRSKIEEAGYQGRYQGVYPIKVNQLREVVEEIVDAGRPYDYGLEAGSKAELAAVIALETSPEALTICNGYKDADYIRTALLGLKMGKKVLIVIEKLSELPQVIQIANDMGVKPLLGMRSKLHSRGSGKWEMSSGDSAKFGLTTPELLDAVKILREAQLEESFKLLHFHIGSQITDITSIKDAVKEATRIYAKLIKMGMNLEFLDVGGGLGVDYDGSRTNFHSSTNYSLSEYVSDVVYTIQEICQAEKVAEPTIVSESGRAVVAHHSVLILDVFGKIDVAEKSDSIKELIKETPDETNVVGEMRYIYENLSSKRLTEDFHDAIQRRDEALTMFKLGILSLEDRAKVEALFWRTCKNIYKHSKDLKYVPEELEGLERHLSQQYLCNFSVFQSLLDHWAIQQLFPIMPIHRLNEEPTRDATLVDITCDSDGKVSKFIDLKDIQDTLKVHKLKDGESYYLGIFLMGAYQDIMGDLHNLFGRVNEVHVFLDEEEPGGYYVEEVIRGNNISSLLSWIQYSESYLKKSVKNQLDLQVKQGLIKPRQSVEFQNFYDAVLGSYTYMSRTDTLSKNIQMPSNGDHIVKDERYENAEPRV